MDTRVSELTQQLAWFQREAILQQEERKRLVDKCKNLEIRCQVLKEDVRFFQANALKSKQSELIARKVIENKAIEQENKGKDSYNKGIKEIEKKAVTERGSVEPKSKNEEIIQTLFKNHNVAVN